MERFLRTTCEGYGASFSMDYECDYDAVSNDPAATATVQGIVDDLELEGWHRAHMPVNMGEDFSAFLNIVPGVYAWIGFASEGYDAPHHNPHFAVNEKALIVGTKLLLGVRAQSRSSVCVRRLSPRGGWAFLSSRSKSEGHCG